MDVMSLFKRDAERRSQSFSIGDPALVEYLGIGGRNSAGERVTESTAVTLSAVYRSVSIIAGTVASLPLKSFRTLETGERERVKSFLDTPGGPDGPTAYEWKETLVAHLLLHGNAYGLHVYNGAGGIVGLQLLHPSAVSIKLDGDGKKVFTVQMAEGSPREFTPKDLTHFPGMSFDGVRGLSPIGVARESIGTGLAADKAAGRMFSNGLLLGGLVTTEEDVDPEEAEEIKKGLKAKLAGAHRAGDIALVNRRLKFSPWTMNAQDAQFLESRAFQVEEVARWFGIPKVLLAEDGASTWGSGINELIRGMVKFTFLSWTSRIEERLSALLAAPRFSEFDYAALLQPNQSEVVKNMTAEIDAGLLTVDEGRRLLNRPALSDQQRAELAARKPSPRLPQEGPEV